MTVLDNSKLECERCHKKFRLSEGMMTTWKEKYPKLKFFCFPCVRKMELEDQFPELSEEQIEKITELG